MMLDILVIKGIVINHDAAKRVALEASSDIKELDTPITSMMKEGYL